MDLRTLLASAALLIASGALAANDELAPNPYAELNKRVQEKLHQRGFYAGPVNGDFGFHTQAALAQFQLSIPLPASGMLDEQTLAALGVELEEAGASPSAGASPTAEQAK